MHCSPMALVTRILFTLLFCNVILWRPGCCQYHGSLVSRVKQKIWHLCRELVQDATMKIAAIQSYRREYGRSKAAQMGELVFDMRSNYKKMTVIYQLVDEMHSTSTCQETETVHKLFALSQRASLVKGILHMIREAERSKETQEMVHERMMSMRSGKQRESAALRVLAGRAPPLRAPPLRAPPLRAPPARAIKRQNQKWRRVVDDDFV